MPDVTVKTRDLLHLDRSGFTKITTATGSESTVVNASYIIGRQTTTSESHPQFFRVIRQNRKRRNSRSALTDYYMNYRGGGTGGPFHTVTHEYWTSHPMRVSLSNTRFGNRTDFEGYLTARHHLVGPTSIWWPAATEFDESSLRAAGATAISLVAPLNPQVSIASALGELRNDGFSSVPGKALFQSFAGRGRAFSALGSEFLNVMFGWKPTISDMQKIVKTVQDSERIIAQLKRDSGRPIRRHFDFPKVVTETSEQIGGTTNLRTSMGPPADFWSSSSGTLMKTTRRETRVWFDGCFSYLLDPGDSAVERAIYHARIAQKLYGLAITPEVLWQLTPWSWAVDWFTNTGDVINNLSNWAISGQTLRWGYVMREERITDTYTLSGPTLKSMPNQTFVQKFITTDKRRIRASPFGFQLEWDGFSNTQLAILAALGISRSGM